MFLKRDSILLGLIFGFLAPIVGLTCFYFIKFSALTFYEFLQLLFIYKTLFTSVLSISLIANAIVFTVFINAQKDKNARGVFIATCVYGIGGLLLKFVL